MYQVEFYEKANGESDIWDFLEELRTKAPFPKEITKDTAPGN